MRMCGSSITAAGSSGHNNLGKPVKRFYDPPRMEHEVVLTFYTEKK